MNPSVVLFFVCAAFVGVNAGHEEFKKMVGACAEEKGVSKDAIKGAFHGQPVTDENVKCVFSCIGQKLGYINNDTVDKEKVKNHIPPHVPEDKKEERRQRNAQCAEISGSSICDTAYQIAQCMHPKRGPKPE